MTNPLIAITVVLASTLVGLAAPTGDLLEKQFAAIGQTPSPEGP